MWSIENSLKHMTNKKNKQHVIDEKTQPATTTKSPQSDNMWSIGNNEWSIENSDQHVVVQIQQKYKKNTIRDGGSLVLAWFTLLYIYTYIHNIYILHNVFAIVFKSKHKVYD